MRTRTTDDEIIDLSDPMTLTPDEIADREKELSRIETKLDALHTRQHQLISELGMGGSPRTTSKRSAAASETFLDQDADIFKDAPVVGRSKDTFAELEIGDSEFDDRFATFVSADTEGDHKARRWLGKA